MTNPLRVIRSAVGNLVYRFARRMTPGTRRKQLSGELGFWRHWLASKGMEWPDDYARRLDPKAPIQDHIATCLDQLAGNMIEILDVGSGPLTKVGKVHQSKKLAITAVDVLADEYNRLLAQFEVLPPVATQYGDAQQLRQHFPERLFDIVYAENSLDHTSDPVAATREMLAVTRPGGIVLLLHSENEGCKQSYEDLHQWDFTCERGSFLVRGPGQNGDCHDMTKLLSAEADVECSLHEGEVLVTIKKHSRPVARS